MSSVADILLYASGAQRRATDPGHSAWVEANAGTGKTKVLTDRVTRLLLAEVMPSRILCLTFTKAAAAEMRNRLAARLGRWAMADDAILDKEIAGLIDQAATAEQRTIARRLFARVLDAPGGINILTIHAFCQALLKRFPLEAGVPPGFDVMDEADAASLLRGAQDEQIALLAKPEAPKPLVEALAAVANKVSIAEYSELMARLLGERAWLLARIADDKGLARVRRLLSKRLGCDGHVATAPDERSLRAAGGALAAGGKQDLQRGRAIAEWLDADAEAKPRFLDAYRAAFFTEKGEVRKTLATKAAVAAMVDIDTVLRREAERLGAELNHAKGVALVDLTIGLLRLGLDITQRYGAAKRRRATLDYDDLIVATRRLLEGAESASWVLYKLDGGIDHVLVDEAQDTNPDQWEVIRRLTEEFFAGA
ncbi:MAG: UvrD-helicase domain-containing protein, partial [Proteobacteria bacterium]|nr:UvrD-helicase domain-containing protein [Pseudomonadota bacterium]